MKYLLSLIISGALVVSGFGQTRNVLVGTNSAVVQPTNFWSADAINARAGLGLGSAATNPSSAFQPASTNLTLLASGDGSSLTNLNLSGLGAINITNISGLQSALDGKLAINGSALNLTNFPETILQTTSALTNFPIGLLRINGDGSGLTNLPVPEFATNVLSTISLAKGGTGATNASNARINLGGTTIGINIFTATDAASARTFLGLGTASTNPSSAFQPSSSVLTNLANNNASSLTNIDAGNIVGTVALASNVSETVALASNVSGIVSVANGGTGGTNASTARDGIGLGTTNTLTIAGLVSDSLTINSGGQIILQSALSNAGSFRTNIGLPWSGLTSADAPAFRTALGLGTASTNPSTAFQASSATLSNLATADGGSLTNLKATNLVGIIPASNISTVNFTNIVGTLSIDSGGTGATNAANARQNLGSTTVGDAVFVATNAAAARTALGSTTIGGNIFTAADASAVRTLLSLDTAATNPASAFQPSSATLSNLATANGGSLTNLQASSIIGTIPSSNIPSVTFTGITGTLSVAQGGTGATNASDARQNLGSTTVGDAVFVATNTASARTALGATTIGGNIFTAADAPAVRTLLSLGTAATNPATAFQPASTNLTLLASNDGSALTNLNLSSLGTIAISNVSGLQSSLDGKLATNGSAAGLTSFPATILQTTSAITNFPAGLLRTNGDGSGLTNLPVPAVASNVLSTILVAKGGTGATNAATARQNLGSTTVGDAVFTATNAAAARTALSLGTASTSASTDFQPSSSALTNLAANNGGSLTNITAGNINGTVGLASNITGTAPLASNVTGIVSLANGGTGGTNATTARNGLGIGTTNTLTIAGVVAQNLTIASGGGLTLQSAITNADSFRTNIGLPWTGLTNTTASAFRTALELGTAATNAASAFQPSSLALTNLAANDGSSLTNIQASNLVGTVAVSNIPTVNLTNISGVLAVSKGGTGATNASDARTALGATTVGNAVFIATNAEAARTALSLGSAATSVVTAFQPANANLTNLSTNNGASLTGIPISGVVNLQSNLDTKLATNGNGSGLTSLTAANINGTVALASNITGTAALATNVTGVVALANGGTGATNAASARTALGATTAGSGLFTLLNPSAVSFLRINADNTSSALNASDFRLAIGLGTAATNASTAFQPSSSSLTNLSANNGSGLSNIAISGVTGLQTALDGKLSTSATAALATNVTGTVALANGGTGATNASGARTALGASTVGGNLFTLVNPSAIRFLRLNADNTATALSASDFRNAIGLSTAATNAESAFQSASTNLTTLAGNNGANLTNIPVAGVVGALATNGNGAGLTNLTAANITGSVAIANGGTGATNAATARTNLGLGWSALTNTDSTNFRNAIGLGATNNVTFSQVGSDGGFYINFDGGNVLDGESLNFTLNGVWYIPISFSTNTVAATTRTNLGLPWSGLTNTNAATFQTALFGANTNPVLVDTNGEVVSPTNFWQVAPITTTFIESEPNTNSSTNIAAARFLHIHSLATNIVNVTNTIVLPTNGATFDGDIALVVHQGPTSSMTRVRTAGSTNDLVTMTRFDEAVEFVYYDNVWQFNHNNSFIEPIYFSGTNAAANAAASRTNLGLGWTNEVQFGKIFINGVFEARSNNVEIFQPILITDRDSTNAVFQFEIGTDSAIARTNLGLPLPALTNTNNANFRDAIELGTTNDVTFNNVTASGTLTSTGAVTFVTNLSVGGAIAVTNAAETRTNLGIPLAALTNTDVTNFRTDIELGATNDVTFNNVTASGTLTATGTVTATTNLVVNGFVDFSTNHTNVAPATNNQIQKFLQIRIGTNAYFLPLYQ